MDEEVCEEGLERRLLTALEQLEEGVRRPLAAAGRVVPGAGGRAGPRA